MSDSELAVVARQSFPAPILIERAGPSTRKKFFEFFTVPIRNANTRAAYYRAIQQFLTWCERAGYQELEDIEPIPSGKRFLLRFKEKGGKEKELPVHHKLEELLDQYLKITGLEKEPESPLFPAALGKTGKLSRRPLLRTDAADMLKRRLKQAGLPAHYSPHSFRATGITNFLENDGTLETAQRIAGHADSRTTKLYDRRGQNVLLEDMERIRY